MTRDAHREHSAGGTHAIRHMQGVDHLAKPVAAAASHNERPAAAMGHHEHQAAQFERLFWISLAATVPVLLLSPMVQDLLRYSLSFRGDRYAVLAIASFLYFYCGRPFLVGMVEQVRRVQPGMMALVGLAITSAYVYSCLVVLGVSGTDFFWELATLIDIMLLGHWIELRSVMGASRALEDLARLLPSEASRLKEDGSVEDVPLVEIRPGDLVLVRPGDRVPVDGEVRAGESELDQATLTGESRPITKRRGDPVIAGSINGTGSLTVAVTKSAQESYLNKVLEMVRDASASKSRAQVLADRAASWLAAIAIAGGGATLFAWLASGSKFAFALERMVTVLVIACPHALGLAVPVVIAVITTLSARNGVLIRRRPAFEMAHRADAIVFDKTGTLTKGEFGVTDVVTMGRWDAERVLKVAASIEVASEHTIARGIVAAAEAKSIKLEQVTSFEALPGRGARALFGGSDAFVGNELVLETAGVADVRASQIMKDLISEGKTAVFVVSGGRVEGIIALEDVPREESREAVARISRMGATVAMITGDNEAVAGRVARELGIGTYFAQVLPDEKADRIAELQAQGMKVAMVGDGVNDAPALARADLGIAIGAGTDVAVETADVVLVDNDPRSVLDVLSLSRIARRKMIQNIAWATGYNVVALPLAAGVLYRHGIVVSPAVGAIVMSVSTIIVAVNARLISYRKAGLQAGAGDGGKRSI